MENRSQLHSQLEMRRTVLLSQMDMGIHSAEKKEINCLTGKGRDPFESNEDEDVSCRYFSALNGVLLLESLLLKWFH
jgi:hypothetical protein